MGTWQNICSKYLNPQLEGKTEKGKEELLQIMRDIGEKTSLSDSLQIAKVLIENYTLNSELTDPIIKEIDKLKNKKWKHEN